MELSNTGVISIKDRKYQQATLTLDSGEQLCLNGYDNIGKCFHGDIGMIDPSGKLIVTQANISKQVIVGVLKYYDRVKFSSNKRGIDRYKFIPLSNCYPSFLVSSKNKSKYVTNVIATIKFLHWNETLPVGNIQQIIGPVNDYNSLYEGIVWKHQLITKYFKLNGVQKKNIKNFQAKGEGYSDLTEEYTISIDPAGCLDIDDAFSWKITESNVVSLKIHISDVIGSLNELGLNEMLNNLTTSVYAPHKNYNMFQNILSQGILSLLPEQRRLAITLHLEICDNMIIESNVIKTIINNHKAFSYDEFERRHFNNKKSPINPIVDVIKNLKYPGLESKFNNYFDSHKLIEKLMIIYNCEVVKILHQAGLKPVYRVHQMRNHMSYNDNVPRDLEKFLSIIKNKSANYTFESSDTHHAALGINNYTHFTSPIRRYVDCYNHQLVHNMLTNENKTIPISLEKINNFNSRVKKMERDVSKVAISQCIDQTGQHNFSGYIYSISDNLMLDFYIPSRKLNLHFRIFHQDLDKILDYKIVNQTIKITHRDSQQVITIPQYQLLDLEIFVCPQKDNPYRDLTFRLGILQDLIQ